MNHDAYNRLLKKYVNAQGEVNYKGLKSEAATLNQYIESLRSTPPASQWSKSEQLTYWINAYNALTLQLVLKYYPIKSIRDIGSSIQVPFVNTPWDIKLFKLSGKDYSLNNIEHDVVRKNFNEPRIHFALVCAAVSCPKLRNEAYQAKTLNEQLADQTRYFLANPSKNKITKDALQLSKLFSWYGDDFKKSGDLIQFLKPYTQVPISENAKISFMTYYWGLNQQ